MPRTMAASRGSSKKIEMLKPIFIVGATYRPLERSRLRTGRSVSQIRSLMQTSTPSRSKKGCASGSETGAHGSYGLPLDEAIGRHTCLMPWKAAPTPRSMIGMGSRRNVYVEYGKVVAPHPGQ